MEAHVFAFLPLSLAIFSVGSTHCGERVGDGVLAGDVGDAVGDGVGDGVGDAVGLAVGDAVGLAVGDDVGDAVGLPGERYGFSVPPPQTQHAELAVISKLAQRSP
jgi:hypothetical protein